MNCHQFRSWLENRDCSDQSESDQALKHKENCPVCHQLFAKDKLFDQAIYRSMSKQPLPENLEKIVSLNLGSEKNPYQPVPAVFIRILSMAAGVGALVLIYLFVPTDYSARVDLGKSLVHDHLVHNNNQDLEKIEDLNSWLFLHSSSGALVPARFGSNKKYQFVGGRICIIKSCSTVHLVYRDGGGLISLYIIDAEQVKAKLDDGRTYNVSNNGYNIELWKEKQQVFAVVI